MRMGHWLLFVYCLALAGCASQPFVRTSPQAIHTFEARGVLALRTPEETDTLHWQWQQQEARYVLVLRGPTGVGTLTLRGRPGEVTLVTPDGKIHRASRPEALLFQTTGWRLPLSGWRYWIRGLPDPALPATTHYDTDNHLALLQQNGWTIHYLHYRAGTDLPDQITLTRSSLFLKLAVRDWSY